MTTRSATAAVLVALVVSACLLANAHAYSKVMGFHEGTRRIVKCPGGHLQGVDLQFARQGPYRDAFVNRVLMYCSSGSLDIEYWGERPGGFQFGNTWERTSNQTLMCPGGSAVAGFKWRQARLSVPTAEIRIAGVTVVCEPSNGQPGQELRADNDQAAAHDRVLKCNNGDGSDNPSDVGRVTALDMWWNAKSFCGLHIYECQPLKA